MKNSRLLIWLILLMPLAFSGIVFCAQEPETDLQKEIDALKKGQDEIRKELLEIKKLLQNRPPSRPARPNVNGMAFKLGDYPFKGEWTAPLTLVEFTDYQ